MDKLVALLHNHGIHHVDDVEEDDDEVDNGVKGDGNNGSNTPAWP